MGFKRDIADLIAEVRAIADMENTQFVTDDQINLWLNAAYRELYNMLINSYELYNIATDDITTVSGTKDYALPADFLKLIKVFYVSSDGREYPLTRMNLHTADTYAFRDSEVSKYVLLGNNLRLWPIPNTGKTIRIYYNPAATVFAKTDTDIDFEQHQDEFCIVSAAVKCLEKEQTPTTELMTDRERLRKQCLSAIEPRDVSDSLQIADVTYAPFTNWWARGWH